VCRLSCNDTEDTDDNSVHAIVFLFFLLNLRYPLRLNLSSRSAPLQSSTFSRKQRPARASRARQAPYS
jgi:hypothetical protein